jgi:hypothetical protein
VATVSNPLAEFRERRARDLAAALPDDVDRPPPESALWREVRACPAPEAIEHLHTVEESRDRKSVV